MPNYKQIDEIEQAMVDALDLIMDMEAEGAADLSHSGECGCEACSHYGRARRLAEKYEPLWKQVSASREEEKKRKQDEAARSEKYVTWWVEQFKAGRNLTYLQVENHFKGIEPQPERRVYVEGCTMCESIGKGGFGPPHDASPHCNSGKRSHCTCDEACF